MNVGPILGDIIRETITKFFGIPVSLSLFWSGCVFSQMKRVPYYAILLEATPVFVNFVKHFVFPCWLHSISVIVSGMLAQAAVLSM